MYIGNLEDNYICGIIDKECFEKSNIDKCYCIWNQREIGTFSIQGEEMGNKKLNPAHLQELYRLADGSHFAQNMNIRLVEIADKTAKVEIDFEDKHCNLLMNIHGGVYASILDTVTWWAIYSEIPANIGYTTIDLNVNDFAMHKKGKLYGEGKAIRVGRSIAIAEGYVKDENGKILAYGTSKFMILNEQASIEAALERLGIDPIPDKFIEE